MVVLANKKILSDSLSIFRRTNKKIGLVPTMGALHQGHMSLIQKALEDNDVVVVSIFVNPTQFDNLDDLEKYPRNVDKDVALMESLEGEIFVFTPTVNDLYGPEIVSKSYQYSGLENQMEGKHREGHFDGVGTILNLLFRAIQPQSAYFGEKDFQQLQIVKELVEIENLPIKIVGCPIVREDNGLAMSSRNKRLSTSEFNAASVIYNSLAEVKQKFNSLSIIEMNQLVKDRFADNTLIRLEYFEIADVKTLQTAQKKNSQSSYRGFIAAYASNVRLIDNMALN